MIRDEQNEIVLATFFTEGIFKDDMLSSAAVSVQVEIERQKNPYYLCSKTITMGSLFTEGEHLYLNTRHALANVAFQHLLQWALQKQEHTQANTLIMRDFDKDDHYFAEAFHVEGFFKLDMPNSNSIDISNYQSIDDLISNLSSKNKKNFKQEVQKYQSNFEVEFSVQTTKHDIDKLYELYINVTKRNQSLNIFPYTKKLVTEVIQNPLWETMYLYLNTDTIHKELVAVCFSHTSNTTYNPTFLGINYTIGTNLKVYKQLLYQAAKRAIDLNKKTMHLGLSADTDKKKIGAKQLQKCAYLSVRDNFNMEILNNIFTT